jgi:hypothetical protein
MLIPHRSLQVFVSHDFHHGFEITGPSGDHSAKVMTATIQNEILWKTGFFPSLCKVLGDET